jgi:HPt (histidine-containing phosphotransfer) domain-containing protein
MADNVIYIDVAEGVKRVMNNTKLYVKLLTKFKDDKNLTELEDALAAGDLQRAQASAHTLKGLAANLSLTELYKQSLALETQIKAGSVDPDQEEAVKNVYSQTLVETDKVIAQYA